MELSEAVRRIVLQHWRLIALFVALGVGLAALSHVGDAQTYTASSRLVLDTQDPESRAESAAIADTARAIAMGPSQVGEALQKAGITGRDQVVVDVRALGSSGILELAVTDRDPRAAAAIANALASELIETRLAVTEGEIQEVLGDFDRRITALNRRLSRVDAKIDSLSLRAATAATAGSANAFRAKRDQAARLRDFLAQQRSVLESQRANLLATGALRPKPSIISDATLPTRADPSRTLPDLVLGALLGLVLGLGVAGLVETFRPKLVGGDAIAGEFDTPHLGTLAGEPDEDKSVQDLPRIAARLRLAAEAAGIRNVELLTADAHVDLARLAERLEAVLMETGLEPARTRETSSPVHMEGAAGPFPDDDPESAVRVVSRARPGMRVRPFALQHRSLENGGAAGLVLVAPATLQKTELVDTRDLLRVLPLPVLGLITYKPSRSRRRGGTVDAVTNER